MRFNERKRKIGAVITTRCRQADGDHAQDVVCGQDFFNQPWERNRFSALLQGFHAQNIFLTLKCLK